MDTHERYDGRTVTLGAPLADTPQLAPNAGDHVWDNPSLQRRSDYGQEPFTQCRACGARLHYDTVERVVRFHPLPKGGNIFNSLVVEPGPTSRSPGQVLVPSCRRGGDMTYPFPATLRPTPTTPADRDAAEVARTQFERVSGKSVCPCGVVAGWHPNDAVDEFLVVLCDGRRVKL